MPLIELQNSVICGNCTHFQPHRDSQTGRVHPSKQGRCGWKPNIKWAMAYRRNGYGWRHDSMVYPVGVWKHTDAKTCACFSPNSEIRQAGPETHDKQQQRNPALPASNG